MSSFIKKIIKLMAESFYIRYKKIWVYRLIDLNTGLRKICDTSIILKDNDISRIIESYNKSKKDQEEQSIQYQVGGLWQKISMDCHHNLKKSFEDMDIRKIKKYLGNFGIDKISIGLSLSGGLPRNFIDKIKLLNTFNMKHYYWKKLTNLEENPTSYVKEIGNLQGINKNGKIILCSSFRLSYFASRINELLFPAKNKVVVEIGGGYGGIPYHFFNEHKDDITYLDFDIPEICTIVSYFLMSNFPNKKFLLYGESNFKDVRINDYDIIIMPNYMIKDLPKRCCDLVFNSHSLTEMDSSTVKEYLYQINRISIKYFLHANHEYDMKYITPDGEVKKTICLNVPEFELPRNNFKRLYRIPEIIENLKTVYGDCSYFEYLYERIKQ